MSRRAGRSEPVLGAIRGSEPGWTLRIEAVTKTYGQGEVAVRALRGVELEIHRGEFVVILGPSGSGKTTLMNIVGAIERPSAGRVTATLRANGMTRGGVSRLLAAENLLLTAVGIVPGLLVGHGTSWAFMGSFTSDFFRFDLAIRPTAFVFIALAVLAIAFLSQRPALRLVSSIDIGREIRVLSA